jgi:2,4-dienoyl-CoA reductase-like NADH-dependent reductase (Old Yellow Enzyme family)
VLNNLFSPFEVQGKKVKNRLVVPAMVTSYCDTDGNVTERYIAYHEAKAKGGFGLIITEANLITSGDRAFSKQAGLWHDGQIEGHSKLTERVHKHGTVIIAQLIHNGRQTNERAAGGKIYAPSAIQCPFSPDMPVELTEDMIEKLVGAFSESALRAKKSGYDGVEVHGAHGYLIAQFMSPYSNKRTDKYGGNLMNRLRFPIEIIESIRQKCGEGFIVAFRISGDELIEGGLTIEDTKAITMILESAGIDMIHVSAGTYASSEVIIPTNSINHGWNVHSAEEIKKVCSIPVITVGRINDPILAESVIKSGKADFVAMGRASLTDPELPNKAQAGKFEDIRQCIGCTVGCLGLLYKDVPIKCILNPLLGKEEECKIEKTENAKSVAVIGAGPAGLEAAIAAAGFANPAPCSNTEI